MADDLKKMYVVLGLKSEGLTKGLRQSRRELQQFSTGMLAAGAAVTGAIGVAVKGWAQAGDEIAKAAKRTGMATETLSGLRYAAELSGSSLASVEQATKNMSRVMLDAGDGMTSAKRTFDRLGISLEEFKKLRPEDQFMTLAGAIASISDPTQRAGVALDVFGKSGTDLLPLFDEGSEGLRRMADEAKRLGIVFTEESAAQAEKLSDSITALTASLDGLKYTVGEAVAPAIRGLADDTTNVVAGFNAWARGNPGVTAGLTDLGMKLGVVVLGVGTLIKLLPTLKALWGGLGGIGGLLGLGATGAGMIGWGLTQLNQQENAKAYVRRLQQARNQFPDNIDWASFERNIDKLNPADRASYEADKQKMYDYAEMLRKGEAQGYIDMGEANRQWIKNLESGVVFGAKVVSEELTPAVEEVTAAFERGNVVITEQERRLRELRAQYRGYQEMMIGFFTGPGGTQSYGQGGMVSLSQGQIEAAGPQWVLTPQERAYLVANGQQKFEQWFQETRGTSFQEYVSSHYRGSMPDWENERFKNYGQYTSTPSRDGAPGPIVVQVAIDGRVIAETVDPYLGQKVLDATRMGG